MLVIVLCDRGINKTNKTNTDKYRYRPCLQNVYGQVRVDQVSEMAMTKSYSFSFLSFTTQIKHLLREILFSISFRWLN
jgi:hypothetical protein